SEFPCSPTISRKAWKSSASPSRTSKARYSEGPAEKGSRLGVLWAGVHTEVKRVPAAARLHLTWCVCSRARRGLLRSYHRGAFRHLRIEHAERMEVGLQHGLLLLAILPALLAQAQNLAQGLDVEAERLGLGELVPDVVRYGLLLVLEPLELLDELAQLLLRRGLQRGHLTFPRL